MKQKIRLSPSPNANDSAGGLTSLKFCCFAGAPLPVVPFAAPAVVDVAVVCVGNNGDDDGDTAVPLHNQFTNELECNQ
jgi:hypothetical protein